ncbi:unnamed protein product [Rangifer tarandus platyrhynchus]|uniref:Uncharacterized protein n=1 Tax=Rangifer tarandus platyrhynchus TaxID=3082113 RepID=A0ABN8ZAN4_RANTA|nr:unnamed protein product [Rangifer tarandus platyrhynchus]
MRQRSYLGKMLKQSEVFPSGSVVKRLCAPNAWGMGSIPGQGTKILHDARCGPKKKKKITHTICGGEHQFPHEHQDFSADLLRSSPTGPKDIPFTQGHASQTLTCFQSTHWNRSGPHLQFLTGRSGVGPNNLCVYPTSSQVMLLL